MVKDNGKILALDVGSVRIGVAIAGKNARIAVPSGTISHNDQVLQQIRDICDRETVSRIVIGLPRGLNGQDTPQTALVRQFGNQLTKEISLPITWQDEAVTSAQAESELKSRSRSYTKEDIDSLAATYILEDYLSENL